jgi:magnesium chelatase family protein
MNNCPCGWAGSNVRTCKCSTSHIVNYKKRISGPILDRIEIHLNMPDKLPEKSLLFRSQREHGGGTGAKLAEAVNAAQEFAKARNDKLGVCANGNLSASQMVAASGLPDDVFYDMIDRHAPGYLSNRGIIRSLRVARTLADLGHRPSISADDFRGAIAWQAESAAASRSDDCMGFSC